MAQVLIVEGNDSIFIATLCKQRGIPAPVGYSDKSKFKDFIKGGGAYNKALDSFKKSLFNTSFTNIGLIIDLDESSPQSRWSSISRIISEKYPELIDTKFNIQPNGIVLSGENMPTIGIWMMPDNNNPGHLEHFIGNMIDNKDKLWNLSETIIDSISKEDYCRFSISKHQKAKLHTWLAWQKNPGKPFGTALEAGFIDHQHPSADLFIEWFSNTFRLS